MVSRRRRGLGRRRISGGQETIVGSSKGRDGSFASLWRVARFRPMSAMPPIATKSMHATNGRDVPKPVVSSCSNVGGQTALLDQFVGSDQQLIGYSEARAIPQ